MYWAVFHETTGRRDINLWNMLPEVSLLHPIGPEPVDVNTPADQDTGDVLADEF